METHQIDARINKTLDLFNLFGNGPSTYFEAKALAKKLCEISEDAPQPIHGISLIKFHKKPNVNTAISVITEIKNSY
jgi:hypothetical protein